MPESRHRVLIVDGDAARREVLGDDLVAAGFAAEAVADAAAALARVGRGDIALAVLAHDLPRGNGAALAAAIKAIAPGTPVVLVADTPPTAPVRANALLAWPCPPTDLLDVAFHLLAPRLPAAWFRPHARRAP